MASCALDLSSTLPDDRTSVERDLCKNYVTNIVHNSSQEQGNVFSAEIMKSNQSESLKGQATFTKILTCSLVSQCRLTEVNDVI